MTEIERLLSKGFISKDFICEEVRCEYLVPSSMKKAWAIQMDLLVKLFEICKKNNLRIWAAGGTLLGAVRHKGFIPWDDDSDVFMPREDHDKLLKLAEKEFQEPYFLQSYLTDSAYPYPYARLRNSRTTVDEHRYKDESIVWNNGIFVDIFPLDGVDKINCLLRFKTNLLKFYAQIIFNYPDRINYPRYRSLFVHTFLNLPFVPFSNKRIIQHMHKISTGKKKFDESVNVGLIQCSPYPFMKNIFKREYWDETVWLPFENIMVPAPKEWDKVLKIFYGDYMNFPPVEKRGKWHELEFDAETPYNVK